MSTELEPDAPYARGIRGDKYELRVFRAENNPNGLMYYDLF